jgi:hypothetical protein
MCFLGLLNQGIEKIWYCSESDFIIHAIKPLVFRTFLQHPPNYL